MSIEKYIDENFDEMIENIASIVSIKTVKSPAIPNAPYGEGVRQGLNATLELAKKMGFKTVNLDNYIGYAEFGEGDEYIAILGHLDVVHEGDGWSTPPYEATIIDGNLYGRGALDNKSPIISSLYSLKALIQHNPNFKTRVRIIFGCNEESGTDDIEYYLSKEQPPKYAFTPDGRFPVIHGEKGMITCSIVKKGQSNVLLSFNSGTKSNVVPQYAEAIVQNINNIPQKEGFTYESLDDNKIKITCIGKSAHAASPHKGINPIPILIKFLIPLLENDPFQNTLQELLDEVGSDYYGETLGIACEDRDFGKLTNNLGIATYNGEEFYIKCNIRYPAQGQDIMDTLTKKFENEFTLLTHLLPLYYPKDHPFIQALHGVYKEVTGYNDEPIAIGGGTYAKLMPNTVAFGPNFPDLNSKAHQADEFIPLDTIKIGSIIYAYALQKISELGDIQ